MRVHVEKVRMTLHRADVLEAYLNHHDAIVHAAVYERTGDVVITYTGKRTAAIAILAGYKFDVAEYDALVTSADSRRLNREYQDKMFDLVAGRCLRKLFLPAPLDAAYTAFRSIRFLWKGVRCVLSRRLEVEVLDALSIGVSLLRGDFGTAGSVMFLLNLGSLLEEWTRKKSLDDLARSMALNVDKVWVRSQGTEVLVPLTKVRSGDEVVVRSGNMIPLDGTVLEGEAMVNQAALTGEAMPVRKAEGSTLYAGTVVEEGECVFIAKAEGGSNRYDKIVAMIEESEKLKSSTENRALVLADKLVPWCLGATVVTYLLTRNATRAISCLMVDFSCALKLSMPLAVLSAMRECGSYHITVKGGKYLEALSQADTIVFDKTGTLTRATPQVVEVVPFSGCNEREVLQLAACLEEHFPHSMANAVVRAAKERGISHEEMHSEVEYIVAHGIASRVGGQRVVIGSHHFVFEDEKCTIPTAEQQKFDALKPAYSHLYMAASGQLVGVICISDPLRPEAAAVLNGLRALGIRNTVMMTGDSERTAAAIAKQVGVDRFFAEVLPEDKANFVQQAKAEGHTVVMIGDGINDSPALSAADIGIAINSGAAIAREIADVTIKADSLEELVALKAIANSLQKRVHANYRFVLTFNSALIALGALGILQPASSAMLHNLSTIGISLKSMTNLLPENKAPQLKA
ncbi:heavy metal translocating P-type ATPase [Faecalibacterium sp. BIOML-A2]|nr:heavy metal translocating P-type ATPase [Faecalibacterium sp. BIOML-A2]MSD60441.1 heavy metal translocating P-type ATPase [Faecalibacterium sp. BIOML-A1]